MNWSKELPQEEGDFLWVSMLGCDCCVKKCGVASVFDVTDSDIEFSKPPRINYNTKDGKHLCISWEGTEPTFYEGKPEIDGWLKLTSLPECQHKGE